MTDPNINCSITITNADLACNDMYVLKYYHSPLQTRNLWLGVKKIIFSKSYFDNNDIILEFGSQDFQRPDNEDTNLPIYIQRNLSSGRIRENYEYQRLFTLCSADLTIDNNSNYTYEPANIRYHKLYPAMEYHSAFDIKQELSFYFRDMSKVKITHNSLTTGSNLQINNQFVIELDMLDMQNK